MSRGSWDGVVTPPFYIKDFLYTKDQGGFYYVPYPYRELHPDKAPIKNFLENVWLFRMACVTCRVEGGDMLFLPKENK